MDIVGSLASEMERLGIARGDELHAPDLADLVLAEVVATGSVVIGRSEVGSVVSNVNHYKLLNDGPVLTLAV